MRDLYALLVAAGLKVHLIDGAKVAPELDAQQAIVEVFLQRHEYQII